MKGGRSILKINWKCLAVWSVLCIPAWANAQTTQPQRPVDLVYPLLDAANSRWFYFSSACRPFGMVSVFPDNVISGDWNGGYRYKEDTIRYISHIHEWQLSGVAVMPCTFSRDSLPALFKDPSSTFSHKKEIVKPGYHSVFLDRYHITAEITATSRVGLHRYRYAGKGSRGIVFQLSGNLGPSEITAAGYEQVSDHEIRGYMVNGKTSRRPKPVTVYFSAVFKTPVTGIYLSENNVVRSALKQWKGANGMLLVQLANTTEPVEMKVGISFTSQEAAAANRLAEAPDWNFDQVVKAAGNEWNEMLGRIKVEGGTYKQQRRFYTDLWHAIQGRRVLSDIDGKYVDNTGSASVVRQVPLNSQGKPKFNMYNSDAFWGAQWTLNTLWDLVYPEITSGFCNSFLQYYKDGGLIPRGPAGGNYTFVMTGAQTTPFYVSAWQKGIRDFDVNLAYEGLRKDHFPGGMMAKAGYEHTTAKGGGIEEYIAKGYVPYPLSDTVYGMHMDGASITLENAYQDWCLAQMARELGKQDDYNLFMERSGNFKHLYNAQAGYMVPKDREGKWREPYDPLEDQHGFEEANGAQATWFVPHALPELFSLMGGEKNAVEKLNGQFEAARAYRFSSEYQGNPPEMIKEERIPVNYSNQPSIQTAFIFNYAGAPWLTQYWSRTVIDSAYSELSPYLGYNGDEDQGLMGSLNVLMKTGLFQMTGGCEADPRYEIASPIFNRITFALNPKYYKAKTFVIEARHNSAANKYVQSATLNGKPLNRFYFRQSDINKGSTLILNMGAEPDKSWGTALE